MATNSMDCTMAGLTWAKDGSWYNEDQSGGYAGAYGEGYYTSCLKFRTPKFAGISERITFRVRLYLIGNGDTKLRWALCSSDVNKEKYTGNWPDSVYSEVEDEYQIAQGIVEWTDLWGSDRGGSVHELTIDTKALKPEREYCLFLWSYYNKDSISTVVQVGQGSEHTATLEYNSGLIQVKYNGEMVSCVVDVASGGEWKQAMPEVAVGGSWKPGC